MIIIAIAVASFIYLNDQSNRAKDLLNKSNEDAQAAIEASAKNTPPADPYAGWNNYQSPSSTFEFKYPANWKIEKSGNAISLIYPEATSTQFLMTYQPTSKEFYSYIDELDKVSLTAYEGKPAFTMIDQQQIKVNGFEAIERTQKVNAADLDQVITYVYDSGKVMSFSMTGSDLTAQWKEVYSLILKSFKFQSASPALETATSTATADRSLSSYNNSAYGFKIAYQKTLKPKTSANGISFTIDSEKFLNISGSSSAMPSLINYHPNGANVDGQVKIGGRDAMKFSTSTAKGDYVQYLLALDGKKWLKIEYKGENDNNVVFENIISSINFNK